MKHADFTIGDTFWCSGRQWRCTDIGTRTIVAIRFDRVAIGSTAPELRRTLSGAEAEAEGWFNGPPYASAESVFDEDDIEGCTLEAEPADEDVSLPVPSADSDNGDPLRAADVAAGIAQAHAIREQARVGGLRFEAYLPSSLADWLLGLIERGMFTDPSEAVFVMLGEQEDLEPHADLRKEILRRSCQAAMDDPRPAISQEEFMKRMRVRMAAPQPEPAIWRRVSL
jgi:hypothetical protein